MKKLTLLFLLIIPRISFAQVSCNLVYERTLQGFNVYIDSVTGATMYRAKEYVDADGSPRAYGPNNSGLDWTANAGSTGNWWGVVADPTGTNPILQTASDPFPGMYVSTTSLVNSNYGISNPLRYVNSETVPFIAMPTNVLASGNIHVGDVSYVYNTTTGQHCFAIYADAGNTTSIGEGSIYLAMQDGVNPDVRTGGTSLGIIDYIVFPQSGFGQGYIPTIAQIDSIGNLYLNAAGGPCIVSCLGPVYDDTPPTTLIIGPAVWDTTSFNVTFTDADSGCVGVVEKSFYQVCDYNSTNEWRANNANGFFNDDFSGSSINPEWTSVTGTWGMNASNYLEQSDQALSNTNIYANLTQNLSDRYLYEWQGKISGTGSNRRAGLEFFCDNPTLPNRGNNYFVWFRSDQSTCEFYKVTNDVFSLVHSAPMTIAINSWYDYKVTYDRINGEIVVYQNNNLVGSWADSSPITNGNSVSFRSGNCDWQIDNFKVFRSRNSSVTVSVGSGNANDIRFQNQNPTTPSGRISSVVTDSMKNVSAVVLLNVNIDFTNPSAISSLNDGPVTDIDTTFTGTQLEANWTSSVDPNSDVVLYYYAIGTTPGGTDVVNWTNNGNNTSVIATGLTLIHQQVYYFSVQAVDGANLKTPVIVSDGQLYFDITTNIQFQDKNSEIILYPNPSNGDFILSSVLTGADVSVNNASGELVYSTHTVSNRTEINLSDKPDGIYLVILKKGDTMFMQRIIIQQ